jgi:hypothetical protein
MNTIFIFSLPSYAISELYKSAAIIHKRGPKSKPDMILLLVTNLLQDSSDVLQTLGLRIIESLCMEHSSLWRSTITTSYQQHQMAKKRFEEQLLKKFMQLSVGCLSKFVQSEYTSTHVCLFSLNLCYKFRLMYVNVFCELPSWSYNGILRPHLSVLV